MYSIKKKESKLLKNICVCISMAWVSCCELVKTIITLYNSVESIIFMGDNFCGFRWSCTRSMGHNFVDSSVSWKITLHSTIMMSQNMCKSTRKTSILNLVINTHTPVFNLWPRHIRNACTFFNVITEAFFYIHVQCIKNFEEKIILFHWGSKFMGKVYPRIPQKLSPHVLLWFQSRQHFILK